MKFSMVSVSFLVFMLFIARLGYSEAICPLPVPNHYEHIQPGNAVVGYFAGWDTYGQNKYSVKSLEQIAEGLTHIIYAFAKPNPETGMCELQDPWADVGANKEYRKKVAGNFAKLLELKQRFPHLKILLSIGGGTYSKYISEIVKKGMLHTFVDSCVDVLDQFKYEFIHSKTGNKNSIMFTYDSLFDGIDLDWEWLNNVVPEHEGAAYQEMLSLLRKKLDEKSKKKERSLLLTVALQVNAKVYNALPLKNCLPYVDWFHVMAYNFTTTDGNGIGHNAPICNPWSSFSIDHSINSLINLEIPPNQLVLGIPLYGHVFDKTTNKLGSTFSKSDITGSVAYDQIKKLYLKNILCRYVWNDKSKVPSLYCPEDSVFVSFDDERSVREKVEYARFKRLKGVMFWKLSGDDDDHSIVKSVFN